MQQIFANLSYLQGLCKGYSSHLSTELQHLNQNDIHARTDETHIIIKQCLPVMLERASPVYHQDNAHYLQNNPIHGSSHLCAHRHSTVEVERDSYRRVAVLFWMLLYPRSIIIIIIIISSSAGSL